MTDKQFAEFSEWYKANITLFLPTNSKPTPAQHTAMFYWANIVDPKGNHKPTKCGRCYYNARNAIVKSLNLF